MADGLSGNPATATNMTITPAATTHLQTLLKRLHTHPAGLLFQGAVGTCRHSVPILKPVDQPPRHHQEFQVNGLTFFVPTQYLPLFDVATLDYEDGFLSQGLHLTWPHLTEGCPNCSPECQDFLH